MCAAVIISASDSRFLPASRAAAALPLRMPVADLYKSHRGGLEISGKLEVCGCSPDQADCLSGVTNKLVGVRGQMRS